MLPDSVEWVLEMLGFDWPTADEDKLRESAQVWRDFADQVDELHYRGVSAANGVLSSNSGDSVEAFRATWGKFSGGGSDGYLADAAMAARLIAGAFDAAAVIVVTCKVAVIAQLVALAVELIAAQAAAPFTLGLSELGAAGATAATKMIVRRLLKELRQALMEAIMETLKEPAVSAIQGMISDLIAQTVNQNFGAQSGYDLGRTAKRGAEDFTDAVKNSGQTFTESFRDGLGSRAGGHVRSGIDHAAGHGDSSSGGHEGAGSGNDHPGSERSGSERSATGGGGDSSGSGGSTGGGGGSVPSGGHTNSSSGGGSSSNGGPSQHGAGGGGPSLSPSGSGDSHAGGSPEHGSNGGNQQSAPARPPRADSGPALDPFGTRVGTDHQPPAHDATAGASATSHDGASRTGADGVNSPIQGGHSGAGVGAGASSSPSSSHDGASRTGADGVGSAGADGGRPAGHDGVPHRAEPDGGRPAGHDGAPHRAEPDGGRPAGHEGAGRGPEHHGSARDGSSQTGTDGAPHRAEPDAGRPVGHEGSPHRPDADSDRPAGHEGAGTPSSHDGASQTGADGGRPSGQDGPSRGSEHKYQLSYDEHALNGDVVKDSNGVKVVTDQMSVPYVSPAATDFNDSTGKPGFTVHPPGVGDSFGSDPVRGGDSPSGPSHGADPGRPHDVPGPQHAGIAANEPGPSGGAPGSQHEGSGGADARPPVGAPVTAGGTPPFRGGDQRNGDSDSTHTSQVPPRLDVAGLGATATAPPPHAGSDQRPGAGAIPTTGPDGAGPVGGAGVAGGGVPMGGGAMPTGGTPSGSGASRPPSGPSVTPTVPGQSQGPARQGQQPSGNSTFTPRPAADRPDPRAAFGQYSGTDTARPAASRPDGGRPDAGRQDGGRLGPVRPDAARPDSGRPDSARPDAARPDSGRPDGARPDAGRVDAGRPDSARPDSARPDGARSDGGRPDSTRPDGGRPDVARPDGGRPDAGRQDGGRLGPVRPDAARPDSGRPDGARPDAGRVDASRSDGARPDTARPDAGRSDAGRSDAVRPDAVRPDTGRPDVGRPDSARPDAARPDGSRPDSTRPDGSRSDAARPDAGRSDAARPDAARPDSTRPDAGRSDGGRPDSTRPDGGRSDAARPDAGRSDAARPDAARPDSTRPDAGRPDAGRPDSARPDAARPDGGRPDSTHPDGSRSDAARPDGGHPDAGRPDADRPDTARPEADHRPDADHRLDADHRPDADSSHPDAPSHPDATPDGHSSRPDGLAGSRPYDTPGGLERPDPQHQVDLESRVPRNPDGTPQRHPDPNGDWPGAVNGDGHRAPGRDNNCLDVALSTADTYSGNPTAAAPRRDGGPEGERGGRDRAESQLGAPFRDMGNGDPAFRRIEDRLRQDGHGSQAVIITQDADGRAHAWNVVNHNGRITYLDNQTGQRSDRPLHDGDHGVFAITLDPDRRPTNEHGGPEHGGLENGAGDHSKADRRPEDPAGKHKAEDDLDDGAAKKKAKHDGDGNAAAGPSHDSSPDNTPDNTPKTDKQVVDERRVNDSDHPIHEADRTEEHLGPKEGTKDEIYGVKPDDAQQALRQSNDVRQLDMDHVYDRLNDWATSGDLGSVLDNSKAGNPKTFNRKDLEDALPGFKEMSPGEQGAAVAAMGRMSDAFHKNHGVGASPEAMSYPYNADPRVPGTAPGEADRASRGGVDHSTSKGEAGLKQSQDYQDVRKEIKEAFGKRSIQGAVAQAGHRPDLTGRNYAVIEVYDPKTKQVSFVVDSSVPPSTPRVGITPLHSETHLGGWMDHLKATRDQKDQPEVLSLYTEREPCGIGKGHADCSGYLSRDQTGVPVYYATGYRTDPNAGATLPAGQLTAKQKMDRDFGDHVAEVGRAWMEMEKKRQSS
ncbi:toxin glutamine deamidase domain-containing protein [Kitasatospora griseola]|uniref:toxin glutamine deamidase domain-containing protein n=1 Tax=Kitasatospora griseola TaxID=2064 RepID=UPI00343D95CD